MSISSELKSEVAVMRRLLVSGANFRLQHTSYLGYIQATLLLNKTIGTPSAVLIIIKSLLSHIMIYNGTW